MGEGFSLPLRSKFGGRKMWIQPTGKICLLHGVPINKDYEHTIYFPTKSDQATYFLSKTKYAFNNQSYTRTGRGSIRVEVKPELIYDCNYLMFENYFFLDNTAFIPETNKKWFYAFITHIEYVNNEVSEVFFEIDVMQTWLHDYTLQECFVERQHTSSDTLYSNLVPEDVSMGDVYVQYGNEITQNFNDLGTVMMASEYLQDDPTTAQHEWYPAEGDIAENVFNGLHITYWDTEDTTSGPDVRPGLQALKRHISWYIEDGKEGSLIGLYMYPKSIMSNDNLHNGVHYVESSIPATVFYDENNNIWSPNNNKLYSSPYTYILVSNNNGSIRQYNWENWMSADVADRYKFRFTAARVNNPAIMCHPLNYCGISEDWEEGILLDSFPRCAWSGDAFKAFWAQNGPRLKANVVGGILDLGLRVATLGVMAAPISAVGESAGTGLAVAGGGAIGPYMGNWQQSSNFRNTSVSFSGTPSTLGSALTDIITAYQRSKHLPNRAYGDTASSYLPAAAKKLKFTFRRMGLRIDILKRIDKFFDRFGYAIMQTATPSRSSRPYYTYVKTSGCTIDASCPEDDARLIEKIFDNGITFWNYRNGTGDVGNYNVDNRPT